MKFALGTVLVLVGGSGGMLLAPDARVEQVIAQGNPSGNGDVNGSGAIDIADAIYLLSYFFASGPAPEPIGCPARALPATGQEECYRGSFIGLCSSTDYPGQDGFYRAGCPKTGRYVDNRDKTVTDSCTGLVWQKGTAPGVYTWQQALKYCEALTLAGQDDWRLPNIRELRSIVDHGRSEPAIDPIFGAVSNWYWSSSTQDGQPSGAWGVHLRDGGVSQIFDAKGLSGHVRAVRGGYHPSNGDVNGDGRLDIGDAIYLLNYLFASGPSPEPIVCAGGLPATGQEKCYDEAGNVIDCESADYPGQDGFYRAGCPKTRRFVDNRDQTVTDSCTGLVWQKRAPLQVFRWEEALKYCEGLSLAGHDDWRLPNIRELESIVDYGRWDPAFDPIFSGPTGDFYFSSSSNARDGSAWVVTWPYGGVYQYAWKEGEWGYFFVRAVRSEP